MSTMLRRAGEQIEQADADDVEGRADRAHDQILERGEQRAAVRAERDQHVGRERRDLEKHESVERIAGDRDAEQARSGRAGTCSRTRPAAILDLEGDRAARERHDHGADHRDQHQNEAVQEHRRGTRCPMAAPSRRGDRRSGPIDSTCHSIAIGDDRHDPAHQQREREGRPAAAQEAPRAPRRSAERRPASAGRCGQTALMRRGPFRRSPPPRSCRRPR